MPWVWRKKQQNLLDASFITLPSQKEVNQMNLHEDEYLRKIEQSVKKTIGLLPDVVVTLILSYLKHDHDNLPYIDLTTSESLRFFDFWLRWYFGADLSTLSLREALIHLHHHFSGWDFQDIISGRYSFYFPGFNLLFPKIEEKLYLWSGRWQIKKDPSQENSLLLTYGSIQAAYPNMSKIRDVLLQTKQEQKNIFWEHQSQLPIVLAPLQRKMMQTQRELKEIDRNIDRKLWLQTTDTMLLTLNTMVDLTLEYRTFASLFDAHPHGSFDGSDDESDG